MIYFTGSGPLFSILIAFGYGYIELHRYNRWWPQFIKYPRGWWRQPPFEDTWGIQVMRHPYPAEDP